MPWLSPSQPPRPARKRLFKIGPRLASQRMAAPPLSRSITLIPFSSPWSTAAIVRTNTWENLTASISVGRARTLRIRPHGARRPWIITDRKSVWTWACPGDRTLSLREITTLRSPRYSSLGTPAGRRRRRFTRSKNIARSNRELMYFLPFLFYFSVQILNFAMMPILRKTS